MRRARPPPERKIFQLNAGLLFGRVMPTFHEPEELNREQGQEVHIPEQETGGKVVAFPQRA